MHNSKLLRLFKVLEEGEVKRLLPFLKSPFFNSNPAIVQLYLFLRKEHPQFNSPKLAREKVFKKVFPGRAYDHQKLLNLASDFITLLEQYLRLLQLEKEEGTQNRLLLKAFAERPKGYPVFEKQVQKSFRRLEKLPYRNADYYRQKFWLEKLFFNHPGTDNFRLSKAQFEASMQHLDQWFVLEKLLLSCEMKTREKSLSESYDIWLLPEIRERRFPLPADCPMADVYLEILNLLEGGEASTYYILKGLFFDHLPQFTRLQQQNILQSLINYTIRQGNQGRPEFLTENLALYQFGLSRQLFIEYGILNDMVYISIVTIALRTGANQWCRQFIEEYERFLGHRARNDAKSLAMALWLFADRQWDATLVLLQKVHFLNVYYQIQARVLLLKAYFEVLRENDAYLELVLSQSASFERYLRRNRKVSKLRKDALLNFVLSVRRLAKWVVGNGSHPSGIDNLRQELRELAPLYNRSWLLQQVE